MVLATKLGYNPKQSKLRINLSPTAHGDSWLQKQPTNMYNMVPAGLLAGQLSWKGKAMDHMLQLRIPKEA